MKKLITICFALAVCAAGQTTTGGQPPKKGPPAAPAKSGRGGGDQVLTNHDTPIIIQDGSLLVKYHDAEWKGQILSRRITDHCWLVLGAVWSIPISSTNVALSQLKPQTPLFLGQVCMGDKLSIPVSLRQKIPKAGANGQAQFTLAPWTKYSDAFPSQSNPHLTLTHVHDANAATPDDADTMEMTGPEPIAAASGTDQYSFAANLGVPLRMHSVQTSNGAVFTLNTGLSVLKICDPNPKNPAHKCPTTMNPGEYFNTTMTFSPDAMHTPVAIFH
jgi:hypothetical protein